MRRKSTLATAVTARRAAVKAVPGRPRYLTCTPCAAVQSTTPRLGLIDYLTLGVSLRSNPFLSRSGDPTARAAQCREPSFYQSEFAKCYCAHTLSIQRSCLPISSDL